MTIIAPLRKPVHADDPGVLSFEDNDVAVEWCENRLLGAANAITEGPTRLADNPLFKDVDAALMAQVERLSSLQTFVHGTQILATGQASDGRIFFIMSGQVSVLVPLPDGGHHRIASLCQGMNFGEMALLGQTTRSASVYADTDVVCRVIETDDINTLAATAPELKIRFLENLAKDLASSLRCATKWIAALA